MKRTFVPLISSGVVGPLGVLHLPRLWLKLSLEARKKLAKGYPAISKGFDMAVIEALGLNPNALLAFFKSSRPTYTEFEAWIVQQQPDKKWNEAVADKVNVMINAYNHDDATRKAIFDLCGLTDQTCSFRDAIRLNQLEDWALFYKMELKLKKKAKTATAPVTATAPAASETSTADATTSPATETKTAPATA